MPVSPSLEHRMRQFVLPVARKSVTVKDKILVCPRCAWYVEDEKLEQWLPVHSNAQAGMQPIITKHYYYKALLLQNTAQ